jgi:uncharacterized membrane protein HdeD (DUF308 family)
MTTTAAPPRAGTSLWWLPLILGLVDIVMGAVILAWPKATVVVLAVLFGIQLLVAGGVRLARALLAGDHAGAGARVVTAAIGVLFLFVGLLCLQNVMQTIAVLVLLVGLTWLVGGVLDIVGALGTGPPSRWTATTAWELAVGVVALVAGVTVLAFPEASVKTLAVLLGIWLLVLGVTSVVSAFRIRAATGHVGML